MLSEFELLVPHTLPEALEMLAERASDVTPLAGGTNVIVDLRDNPHRYRVLNNSLIAKYGSPLREAASVLGSPLVRNRATVGGNLVDASPAADTVPPLLALDAEVDLASQEGTRRLPLEAFMVGSNETRLRPNELPGQRLERNRNGICKLGLPYAHKS